MTQPAHTDPTLAKLFSEILRVPEDDTLRLVYADRLQEVPPTVWAGGREVPNPDYDPAHAELIRVQVELSRVGKTPAYDERQHWLAVRANALIAANRDRWLRVKCPKCRGGKAVGGGSLYPCRHCEGGDAGWLTWIFEYPESSNRPRNHGDREPVRVTWDRGFPFRVEVPGMRDCVDDDGREYRRAGTIEYRPRLWLRAVVTHHPTVLEVVPLDREPVPFQGVGIGWWGGVIAPGPVFDIMWEANPEARYEPGGEGIRALQFPTREAAISALGRAVVQWARA